jgi:hypothetical protein
MRSSQLPSAAGRLQDALDVLLRRWEETRELWKDSRAEQFEEEFIRPLREELAVTIPAVGLMAQVLQQAGRELADE